MGALAGLGVGGAVGGLVGALVGLGIPEYEAKRYEGRVKDGGVLLSVHCDSSEEVSRAKDILKATGAEDIASSGEKSVSTHGVETDRNKVDRARVREVETERMGVSSTSPSRTVVDKRDREIG
jgi:hypothetical protein